MKLVLLALTFSLFSTICLAEDCAEDTEGPNTIRIQPIGPR